MEFFHSILQNSGPYQRLKDALKDENTPIAGYGLSTVHKSNLAMAAYCDLCLLYTSTAGAFYSFR